MRLAGVECFEYKRIAHEFEYRSESPLCSFSRLKGFMKDADVIQISHTDLDLFILAKESAPRAKIIMHHTGTKFRNDPDVANKIIEDTPCVTDHCELIPLIRGKGIYYMGSVDTDIHSTNDYKFRFGHYPSNQQVKGTDAIVRMMDGIESFSLETKLVKHSEHIDRMKRSAVIIELFSPEINGREYCHWGVTAMEAAALSRIVMTQNRHNEVYREAYGYHPMLLCNTETDFIDQIYKLSHISERLLKVMMNEHRQWVVEKHSLKSSGEYIRDKVLNA